MDNRNELNTKEIGKNNETRKPSNPLVSDDRETGAAASAAAGARNLTTWQKQQANQPAVEGLAAEEFRRALVAEVGPDPSAVQLGLISAACATFEALQLGQKRLRRRRKRNVLSFVEAVSQLSGNLRRLLSELGLPCADSILPPVPEAAPPPTLEELVRSTENAYELPTWALERGPIEPEPAEEGPKV